MAGLRRLGWSQEEKEWQGKAGKMEREREGKQGAHDVREGNEWKILHGGENEREEQLNEGVAGSG